MSTHGHSTSSTRMHPCYCVAKQLNFNYCLAFSKDKDASLLVVEMPFSSDLLLIDCCHDLHGSSEVAGAGR